MRDATFEKLRAMVRTDDTSYRGRVDPETRQRNWNLYAGEECWTRQELEAFRAVKVQPFALNFIGPIIDGYIASLSPQSLEPAVKSEDAASSSVVELANAFLLKARKVSRVDRIEERVPLHMMITSVVASMSTVVSEHGRTVHRVEMLQPEQVRWDPRAIEPNAEDAMWIARIASYTIRELKLKLPTLWQKLRKLYGSAEELVANLSVSETLFSDAEERGGARTNIDVVTLEWRELRSYLMIPKELLTEYDSAAAADLSLEITVDGLRLEAEEVDDFVDWMERFEQDPGLERAQNWQGQAFYYAIVVGNEIVEQGQLSEGCFRIQLCCGPEVVVGPSEVKYRSVASDLANPQTLVNHAITSQLTTISKISKGAWAIGKSTTSIPEIARSLSTPGAIIELDNVDDIKSLAPDMSVLEPTMAVLRLGQEAMDTRMGTSALSRGNVGAGDKVTRTSSRTVEALLEKADAPIKAYYARYMRWRVALGECMVRQITHWDWKELAGMVDASAFEPVYAEYGAVGGMPTSGVPSGALWQVAIDLKEPKAAQKMEMAANLLSQGILPQLAQLGVPMPPDLIMELTLPQFGMSDVQTQRWVTYLQQVQMQQMQQQPPQEAPAEEGAQNV